MLGHPQGFKAVFLDRPAELGGMESVVGRKDAHSDLHLSSRSSLMLILSRKR
jgi:hypothetical protein